MNQTDLCGRSISAVSFFSLVLLLFPLAAMSQNAIFDTTRMVEGTANQCQDVPDCITMRYPWTEIAPETSEVIGGNCPDDAPYVWHWDARYHEHLAIKVLGRTESNLTFVVNNRADEPGRLRIKVGCSSHPFDHTIRGHETYSAGLPSLQQFSQ